MVIASTEHQDRHEAASGRWSSGWRVWLFGTVILLGASAAILAWAGTRPAYDPYGWLVWGDQAAHLRLDLGGAPSWKPLPFLFTFPYALAGGMELWLWMVTAIAISLAGCAFAGRIAYRVVGEMTASAGAEGILRRLAPAAAAVVAGVGVLEIQSYPHYILSVQSDPLVTTFWLAAIDSHLRGRYRWALVSLVLAALGRPEVWPFLVIYTIWGWWRVPAIRWPLILALAIVGGMWFAIPWITNGRPDLASRLALNTRQVLHHGQAIGTLNLFTPLHELPMWIAAIVAAVIAAARRNWVVLALAASVVLWVVIEIAFALRSFPVLPRFMFEAAAVTAVLGGVGVGSLMTELARLPVGISGWRSAAAVVTMAAAAGLLVPEAIARVAAERSDLQLLHRRSTEIRLLEATIDALGGPGAVRACGEPVTYVEYASALAWLTDLNVGRVGYKPRREMRRRYPIVLFRPEEGGVWTVQPWHNHGRQRVTCSYLHAAYLIAAHPASPALGGAFPS